MGPRGPNAVSGRLLKSHMIGLVPSPGLYCHLCRIGGCWATLRGATRVRPPRQEPDGCRHQPGRCCSPQAPGPFSCRRKKVEGHPGRGGWHPLTQPCLLRENCPVEKGRAPRVSGGPAQAGYGAAALRSSQVDQQRHAQSVPSSF